MPYIEMKDREAIKAKYSKVRTPGDLNFLIFMYMLNVWKTHPRYDTIHCFKRDFVVEPKNNSLLQQLRTDFCDIFTVGDVYAASAAAYDEFMRRVGNKYEDKKVAANGDIPEIEEALNAVPTPAVYTPEEEYHCKVTILSSEPANEIEVK